MNTAHIGRALRGGLWGALFALLTTLSLGGCGSGDSSTTADSGEVQVALKDAPGDFLAYRVDVTSLTLTRANGAVVQALPVTTTVDFAQYVDLSELLTAATVPAGRYAAVQMTLDYSNAEIQVEETGGDAVTAQPVDANGNPLTSVTVNVTLQGDGRFVIAPGIPTLVTLDFDLSASNTVNFGPGGATVTVQPTLLVDASIDASAEVNVRGLLGSVAASDESFALNLRPFHHRVRHAFGSATVHVTDATVYEINGTAYVGAAGLTQMAQLAAATPVVTSGTFETANHRYTAAEVRAGSSVPWSGRDLARGVVVARNGDTLTLRGASLVHGSGAISFGDSMTVTLGAQTTVSRQDSAVAGDLADVSVGQAVWVTGQLNGHHIDATSGHVRLRMTEVLGSVASLAPLTLNVERIEGRAAALFDFAGTGTDTAHDADPAHYEINTAALDLSALQVNDPVRLRGFVHPFGGAPADFDATTLVQLANTPAQLIASYGAGGSDSAVVSLTSGGLQLATPTGAVHTLIQGGLHTDLLSLEAMPLIAPQASGAGIFAVARGGEVRLFVDFGAFAAALNGDLAAGVKIGGVTSGGVYAEEGNTLTAHRVTVREVP